MTDMRKSKAQLVAELEALRRQVAELESAWPAAGDSGGDGRPQGGPHVQASGLLDRVWELNCLYGLARLIEAPDASLTDVLRGTVDLLPSACRFPHLAGARLACRGEEFRTVNYRQTPLRLSGEICVHGERAGEIELSYAEQPPPSASGPFLPEEAALVDAIAERLGRVIERFEAEEALRASEDRFKRLFDDDLTGDYMLTADSTIQLCNPAFVRICGCGDARELAGRAKAFLHAEPGEWESILGILKLRGRLEHYPTTLRRADGRLIHAVENIIATKDAAGEITEIKGYVYDDTERTEAEEALRESEERLRLVTDTIEEVFWMADAAVTRMLYVSPGYERVWGRSAESLYAEPQSFLDAIHPDDAGPMRRSLLAEREGRPFTHEYRIIRPDGSVRWILDRGFPVRDHDGKVRRYAGIAEDVTERKRVEQELRESQTNLRAIAENTPDHIFLQDRELRYHLVINPPLGLAEVDMLGRRDEDFLCPQDADIVTKIKRKVLATGEPAQVEAPLRSQSGAEEYFEGVCIPTLDDSGRVDGLVGYFRDVTERRRVENALRASEKRFREVLDRVRLIAVELDRQGCVTYCNDCLLEITGWNRDEVLGQDWFGRFLPEYKAASVRAVFERSIEGDEFVLSYENPILTRAGLLRDVHWNNVALRDAQGQIVGVVSLGADVTERIKAEAALREASQFSRQVISSANAGIIVYGEDLRYQVWNPYMERLTGLPAERVLGRHPLEVFPFLNKTRMRERLEAAAKGERCDPLQFRYDVRETGRSGWCLNTLAPLRNVSGEVVGVIAMVHDITERKRAESEIELQSEITKNLAEGIYLVSARDLTIVYANPKMEEMFGYGPGEMTGRHVSILNAPTDHDPQDTAREIERALAETGLWRGEVMCVRKNGSTFWTEASISRHEHPEYGVVYISAQTDINERKRADEALRASEERYRRIIEAAMDGFWLTDTEGRLLHVNEAYCRMSGYTVGELLSMHIWDLEAVEGQGVTSVHIKDVLVEGQARFESRHRRKDGSTYDVEVSVQRESTTAKEVRLVAFLRDITERKNREQEIHRIEEVYRGAMSAAGGIPYAHTYAPEERYTFLDSRIANLIGYPLETITPGFFESITVEDNLLGENAGLSSAEAKARSRRGGSKMWLCEFSVRCRDGGIVWLFDSAIEMLGPDGLSLGSVGMLQDITARKRAEEERKKLEEQLRQSQKMEAVGQLAGGVAHDFNNLLQVILGNLELLRDEHPMGTPARDVTEEISAAAHRAADLTRQLLAFSRRQVMQPVDADLNDLIEGLLKMIRRLIGEHIELHFIAGAGLDKVRADKGQMEQVLMNLCVNARDAMPQGGILEIETKNAVLDVAYCRDHPWASQGQYVHVRVSDTGHGMDDETKAHIFEPFFTTKGVGQGTGLGLATVYGILKQHKGLIDVSSEPGGGTVFDIYLPARKRARVPEEARNVEPPPHGTETLLVAEDEPAVLRMLAQMLGKAGYTVLQAVNGDEALRLFESNRDRIKLVILDVMMPGLNGLEVLKRIRAGGSRVPCLFSSGYSRESIHPHSLGQEGVNLMTKPYRVEVMLREVRRVLDADAGEGAG